MKNLIQKAEKLTDFMWRHNHIEDPGRQLTSYMGYEMKHFHDHAPRFKRWYEEAQGDDDYYEQISEKVEEMFKAELPFTDVMGPIYMALRSKSKGSALGQFFTPQSVCDLMAQMTISEEALKKDKAISLSEPCSGSGALLMASAKTAYKLGGKEALLKLDIHANDLDPICTGMTSLQFIYNWTINQMPVGRLVTYNGNALTEPDKLERWINITCPTSKYLHAAQHQENSADEKKSEADNKAITPSLEQQTPEPLTNQMFLRL